MNKQSYLYQSLRAMPILIYFYGLVNTIISPGYKSLLLLIILSYDKLLNSSLKTISEYIYDLYNIEEPYIIGRGKRPNEAISTGCFLKYPEKKSNTYGMPSGHSQTAWLFATYLILNIYYLDYSIYGNELNKIIKIINILFVILTAFMVSFSRVIEKCHTWQQVVIGGLIGCLIGYYTFKISGY
jgi:membrane-associated phospholipid phosphatase